MDYEILYIFTYLFHNNLRRQILCAGKYVRNCVKVYFLDDFIRRHSHWLGEISSLCATPSCILRKSWVKVSSETCAEDAISPTDLTLKIPCQRLFFFYKIIGRTTFSKCEWNATDACCRHTKQIWPIL